MPKLTKIYTRKGDDGTTALGGGQRVAKESLRVSAYGTVDEVNSHLGVALAHGLASRISDPLQSIQNELFHLGSDLCFVEEDKVTFKLPQIEQRHVDALESQIDALNGDLGTLDNFMLPGGAVGAAHLHVARTSCRRAEREVSSLSAVEPVGSHVLAYLNRLSDLLFVMARYENKESGIPEPIWDSHL